MKPASNTKFNAHLKEELKEGILSKERLINELMSEIQEWNLKLATLDEESDKGFGNCIPPILPTPAKDTVLADLESVIKLIDHVKSASYTKDEEEIKIEIVLELPKLSRR